MRCVLSELTFPYENVICPNVRYTRKYVLCRNYVTSESV